MARSGGALVAVAVALAVAPALVAPGSARADAGLPRTLAAGPVLVRGTAEASPDALAAARDRVERLLARAPTVAANLARDHVEAHLFGRHEVVTDLPELRHLRGTRVAGVDFDHRYHGGRAYGRTVACGEENLLHAPSDPYPRGYEVCTHELAHLVFDIGLDGRTRLAVARRYRDAVDGEELWAGTYAAQDVSEFFAELSMKYVHAREALEAKDPETFALLDRIYRGVLAQGRNTRSVWKRAGAAAATTRGVPTTFIVENRSSRTVRVVEGTHPAPHVVAAGIVDSGATVSGTRIALVDEATRRVLLDVFADESPGIVRLDEATARAAAASDASPRFDAPFPL